MKTSQKRTITLVRIFPAAAETLFSALTDAARIKQWWGPDGWDAPEAEIDCRVGGIYSVSMKGADGPVSKVPGIILELEGPRHLCIESRADALDGLPGVISKATFDITEHPAGSRLELRVAAEGLSESANAMLAGMQAGWNQSLQKLEDYLEGRAGRLLVFQNFIQASPEKVWTAWSDIDRLGQWWGPDGFTITNEHFKFGEGEEWRFTMHGPDGSDYPQKLLFGELLPYERIRYRHLLANFDCIVLFDEMFGNTVLSMRLVFANSEELAHNVAMYHADHGGAETLARLSSLFKG